MKRIWLIAFLFNMMFANLAGQNLFLDNTKLCLTYSRESPEESSAGGKLQLPFSELRFYQKLESKENTYSVNLNTSPVMPKLPVSISYGKLGYSGSYSKLNNPPLSAVISPWSAIQNQASEITALLPSNSNYSKEDSLFFKLDCNKLFSAFPKISLNGFLQKNPGSENKELYGGFSTLSTIKLSSASKLSVSFTSGLFPYDSPAFTTWFNSQPFYCSGNHWCSQLQTSFSSKYFSSCVFVNLYESPFKSFDLTFRAEQQLKLGRTKINTSFYYNNQENLLTINKSLENLFQAKAGISESFPVFFTKPLLINTGINSLYSYEIAEQIHKIKLTAGGKLTTDISNFSVVVTASGNIENADGEFLFSTESFSAQAKYSVYLKVIKPYFTGTVSFEPLSKGNWKTTEKLKLDLSLTSNPKLSFNSSVNFIQSPEKENKAEYACSIKFLHKTRFLDLTCSCNFDF